jgi:hypothetical protein
LKFNGWRAGAPFGSGTGNFEVIREWDHAEIYRRALVLFAERLMESQRSAFAVFRLTCRRLLTVLGAHSWETLGFFLADFFIMVCGTPVRDRLRASHHQPHPQAHLFRFPRTLPIHRELLE